MCEQRTAPAEAYAPDPNRAGPGSPALVPHWLAHLLALLIVFGLECLLAFRPRRGARPLDWLHERPDLPPGSAQQLAASIRGQFGNAIAWMCRRRGIGPGHPDWPELSRAIVAFGGSIKGFRPGMPALGLQWWENPNIIPGMIGETVETPAATALSSLLSRQQAADAPPPPPLIVPAEAEPAVSPAPRRPVFARAATGPPTGPPFEYAFQFCRA